ncbi:hypothetical protein [Vitreoscilla massiliensis]|uniref:hypothetical protein n=1 Tax=Vitreoscilla massiliensis TaxID=1689272 RepID=UPI00131E4EA6|nr:hypothetical protein [Vitreoscilla massiliensis]
MTQLQAITANWVNSGTSLTFELADNLNVSTIKAGDTVTGNYIEIVPTAAPA